MLQNFLWHLEAKTRSTQSIGQRSFHDADLLGFVCMLESTTSRRLAVQGHHGQPRRKQRLVTGSREHRRHESRCSGTETTDSSYCGRPTDNPRQNRSSSRHGQRTGFCDLNITIVYKLDVVGNAGRLHRNMLPRGNTIWSDLLSI